MSRFVKTKSFLKASLFGVCVFSCIQTTSAQTLQDTVSLALDYHPQVAEADANVSVVNQDIRIARSEYFPVISLGAQGGRIYADNSTSRGTVTTRGAAYSGFGEGTASLRQPIFNGFQTQNRVKSSKAEKESAVLQLHDVQERISFQAVQAYLNVLQTREVLNRVLEQKASVDDYVQRIETNVEDGGADESKLQQAIEVRVLLKSFIADYESELKKAEAEYIQVTGILPPQKIRFPTLDFASMPAAPDQAIEIAYANHPALEASNANIDSAKHGVKAERGVLYPELTGELSYLQSDRREEIGGEVTDARAVLRLGWDFETGGGQLARIKQRKYEVAQAKAREHDIRIQIERNIRNAYAELDVTTKQLENQQDRVKLNKKLFETYQVQFEGGVVDILQLMQADNELFTSEVEELINNYSFVNALYAVMASTGGLKDFIYKNSPIMGNAEYQTAEK